MEIEQHDDPLFVRGTRVGRPPEFHVEMRVVLYALVTMLVVSLAGWLYLQQATRVAEEAHAILLLEDEKQVLTRKIVGLRAQVAQLGSLQRLHEEADRQQYVLPKAGDTQRRWFAPLPSAGEGVPTAIASIGKGEQSVSGGLGERLRDWLRTLRAQWLH